MTKLKKVLLTSIICLVLMVLGTILTFFILGRSFLVIDDNPEENADAIIVLSGGAGRLSYAMQWYEPGTPVILTNSTKYATTREHALELGIDSSDIIEEPEAEDTYTNATLSRAIMQEKGFNSALVVTSDYHTRRTKMTFNKIYDSSGIELSYAAAPSHFSEDGPMSRSDHFTAVSEYLKLSGYWLTLFIF
ncbi:YdcF family protein [Halobacillus salinus]|uniref:YdcF family protein n=1 Tax=Halobacillus salinus TaxID=192814 RepID=UPI00158FBFB8|nr:YdcF family protein [Halobacillus salinus]